MKPKSRSLFQLARSLRASEMKDAVVDEFVSTRARIAFIVACASDLASGISARMSRRYVEPSLV